MTECWLQGEDVDHRVHIIYRHDMMQEWCITDTILYRFYLFTRGHFKRTTFKYLTWSKLCIWCACHMWYRWIEACINEKLPQTTELEEGLRNGVFLAKLAHFISADLVPLKRIYDRDQARFQVSRKSRSPWRPISVYNLFVKGLKKRNTNKLISFSHVWYVWIGAEKPDWTTSNHLLIGWYHSLMCYTYG